MLRTTRLAALAGAAAITLTACSSTGSDEEPSTGATGDSTGAVVEGGDLRYGSVVDISTWIAADAAWGNEATYYMAVYDSLLRTSATNEIEPGLAEAWEYNDDLTELTLDIRDGVTFTDGTALDAQVVVDNLNRFREGASPDRGLLDAVADVTAADEDTVVIALSAPDPALEINLSMQAGLIASPSTFDAEDAQTTPVGTGPYMLDSAASTIGATYVFTPNEDYWAPEDQHYESLTINYYADASALLNALRDNQVDVANLNSVTQIPDAESAGYTINTEPVNWKGIILADRWGMNNGALGDVRVRQAINYALDREGLLQGLEAGYGEVTTQIFNTEGDAFDSALDEAYPYDPEKAKSLLAEAGYADGVTIVMPQTGFVPASEYELIAGVLAESNIFIEYEQAGESFFGDLLGGTWSAFNFGLNQEPLAWQTYNQAIAPGAAWNVFHQADETVEGLAARIRLGGEDGAAAAQELNAYMVEEAWFAPFYRVLGVIVSGDGFAVTNKSGQAVANLWDITPA
ncbi:ABC transporter substrate-binding protein [Demequina rhizosphaerae]|uniref:ABC transporter substrate-binding protein n=1 Tax=Demequina rhizosphaerae TaxID=1638985 RepID=UPI00078073C6|nr:ABC transporter substrate-binding protein [Demequina rhizosphaerae]